MKRLVFCFDGTWNRLDAAHPTNVVLTAQSVAPLDRDGTTQAVFYDEGVGTGRFETLRGGAFGRGLVRNLEDGYRFLVFNYEPGDEIYVFGFSRGAYTARSFVGLLATVGVLIRHEAKDIGTSIEAYKQLDRQRVSPGYAEQLRAERSPLVVVNEEDRAWRIQNGYAEAASLPLLNIAYLGVWDTVGSLGIPSSLTFSPLFNKRHRFHDTSLSAMVARARHAVAIDERRTTFEPTLWDNIDDLNSRTTLPEGQSEDHRARPYQEVWFPGTHGAVGGGGDRRGLSDNALQWVWEGAQQAGLQFSDHPRSLMYAMQPDHTDWLNNTSKKPGLFSRFLSLSARDRPNGPDRIDKVSTSTIRRWHLPLSKQKEGRLYRPKTLSALQQSISETQPKDAALTDAMLKKDNIIAHHKVARGQTLSHLAKHYYGQNTEANWMHIFEHNTDVLDDPNRIYIGQMLRIPKSPDYSDEPDV